MSQRFNAPPGWQVPPNFTPPEGWQPEPSWPSAPAGWNYWVDDGATAGSAAPMVGQNPGYGASSGQNPGYGASSGQNPGYGPGSVGPAGASPYGEVSGTATAALAQEEIKKARNSALIGFGILVVAVVVWVVSYSLATPGGRYLFPWYFMLAGLIVGIRGLVGYNKAKKAASFTAGGNFDPTAYSGPAGVTPPGVTPPGGYPAPGSDAGPRPGEYRP